MAYKKIETFIKELKYSPTLKELKFMLHRVRQSPLSMLGSIIIIFFALVAILAPYLAPPNPDWDVTAYPGKSPFILPRTGFVPEPQPPSPTHPFGLTSESFDIYYGCVWGTITAFRVGITVVAATLIIGLSIGLLAAYYGGIIDEILMRFTDVIIVFPGLILALAFALAIPDKFDIKLGDVLPICSVIFTIITVTQFISKRQISWKWILMENLTLVCILTSTLIYFGNFPNVGIASITMTKLDKVLAALILVGWPGYARVIRGEVLRIRNEDYVEAAKAAGCSDFRIMVRHILPNAIYPIVILASLDIGSIVLLAAALSFLRVGAEANFADWGQLVEKSRVYLGSGASFIRYWYIWVIPGAFIFVFSLGWNLLGDALRDILDPTLRRR